MMSAQNNGNVPQVGRELAPQSHPVQSGCPKDSGGGKQTSSLEAPVVGDQATVLMDATGRQEKEYGENGFFKKMPKIPRSPTSSVRRFGDFPPLPCGKSRAEPSGTQLEDKGNTQMAKQNSKPKGGVGNRGNIPPFGQTKVQSPPNPFKAGDVMGNETEIGSPNEDTTELGFIRRQVDDANEEEGKQLDSIGQILKEMEDIFKGNHRIPTAIKDGVRKVRDTIYQINLIRETRLKAVKHERALVNVTASPLEMKGGKRKRTKPDLMASVERSPISVATVPEGAHAHASSGQIMQVISENSDAQTAGESSSVIEVDKEDSWQEDRQARRKRKKKEKQSVKAEQQKSERSMETRMVSQKSRRLRPDAILIRSTSGRSYADLLKEIRVKVKPEEHGADVRAIRQTRTGGVLLELGAKTKNRDNFSDALKNALGECGTVRNLEPKTTLEIRDLDSLTTVEEVREAILRDLGENAGDVKVFLTRPNSRELKLAVVSLSERGANILLKAGRIKVGWVSARIRRRVEVIKCFRCFGFGHLQTDCKGPDRRSQNLCLRCGGSGHKKDSCIANAKCCLCVSFDSGQVDADHVPGARACLAFKQALERATERKGK
jgi:hypothetical protein